MTITVIQTEDEIAINVQQFDNHKYKIQALHLKWITSAIFTLWSFVGIHPQNSIVSEHKDYNMQM
jgi:hypothetical protein